MDEVPGDIPFDWQMVRRAERSPVSQHVVIRIWPEDGQTTDLEVDLIDFSAFGAGFDCAQLLERGQQFTLHFRGPAPIGAAFPPSLLYSVAHCRLLEDGRHRVGAEFVCVTPPKPPETSVQPEDEQAASRIRGAILSPASERKASA